MILFVPELLAVTSLDVLRFRFVGAFISQHLGRVLFVQSRVSKSQNVPLFLMLAICRE